MGLKREGVKVKVRGGAGGKTQKGEGEEKHMDLQHILCSNYLFYNLFYNLLLLFFSFFISSLYNAVKRQ